MKNLWPQKFETQSLVLPKKILEEQAEILSGLTNGYVTAEVSPMTISDTRSSGLRNEFAFKIELIGPYLNNYRYEFLRIAHGIVIYPLKASVDESIAREIKIDMNSNGFFVATVADSSEFEDLLTKIFHSTRINKTISSIIALSN